MKNKDNIIELSNVERYEHCILDKKTGEKTYSNGKKQMPYFTGLYFRDENIFFALYPTSNGPIMYYEGKEYPLKKIYILLSLKGKI